MFNIIFSTFTALTVYLATIPTYFQHTLTTVQPTFDMLSAYTDHSSTNIRPYLNIHWPQFNRNSTGFQHTLTTVQPTFDLILTRNNHKSTNIRLVFNLHWPHFNLKSTCFQHTSTKFRPIFNLISTLDADVESTLYFQRHINFQSNTTFQHWFNVEILRLFNNESTLLCLLGGDYFAITSIHFHPLLI